MRPVHYLVLALVVAAGAAISALLVPQDPDLGLMYLKGKHYAEARALYEARLAGGDFSINVVMPLIDLYLEYGQVDKAAALLERLRRRTGDSVELERQRARLEQFAAHPERYLQTLEKINQHQTSEEGLRKLAQLYRYFNQQEKLIGALRILVRRYPSSPDYFLELARLEAARGSLSQAASVLEEMARRHPGTVTDDSTEFLLSLLLDLGQAERAFSRAVSWLGPRHDVTRALRLALLFHWKHQPGRALSLLRPYEHAVDVNPELLAEFVQLQIDTGQADAAFARLERLLTESRLPDEAVEPFVSLALARKQIGPAIRIVQDRGMRLLPDWLLANLAESAMSAGRAEFVRDMMLTGGDGFLADRPVLAARLAFDLGDRPAAVRWMQRASLAPRLASTDRAVLASLYLRLQQPQQALAEIRRLKLNRSLSSVLDVVAETYLQTDQAGEGVERLARLRGPRFQPAIDLPWSLLATASGRAAEVIESVSRWPAGSLKPEFLRNLYYVANDHGATGLVLTSARGLYAAQPNLHNRALLARAWLSSGQPLEALPHFRALLRDPSTASEIEQDYISALEKAVQAGYTGGLQGELLREELRDYWTAKLARGGAPDQQRLEIAYRLLHLRAWREALPVIGELASRQPGLVPLFLETAEKAGRRMDSIALLQQQLRKSDLSTHHREEFVQALLDLGGARTALPYLRDLAENSDEKWAAAYESTLEKLGLPDALAELWQHRAARPDVSDDTRRQLAHNLLAAGRKPAAEIIFRKLAEHAKPQDGDVRDLLFLWGDNPPQDGVDWLQSRAQSAPVAEKAGWLRHLIEVSPERASQMAVLILPRHPAPLALLDACARALERAGKRLEAARIVEREAADSSDLARLRALARLARELDAPAAARTAYSGILRLQALDPEALRWLGVTAYERGQYTAAGHYLKKLEELDGGDAQTDLYLGELFARDGDYRAAGDCFRRGLSRAPGDGALRAHLLLRAGEREAAYSAFRRLMQAHPQDSSLRADFAVALMETGRLSEARQVLGDACCNQNPRLTILRAELAAATRREAEGLAMLERLRDVRGDDPRVLGALATMEQRIGRPLRAAGLLDQAVRLDPDSEDLSTQRTALLREMAPGIQAELDQRSIEGYSNEWRIRLQGQHHFSRSTRMGFIADHNYVTVPAPGESPTLKKRMEVFIQSERESGLRLKGSLYSSRGAPGMGISVTRPDSKGTTALEFSYRQPYWEFMETLVNGGTRHRIETRRETRHGTRLNSRFTAGWSRYDLPSFRGAARSVTVEAAVNYRLTRRRDIVAEYSLDAEHALSANQQRLPLRAREVHAGALLAGAPLTPRLRVEGSAGVAYDRLGSKSPFGSIGLAYDTRRHFTAKFGLERRLYFLDTSRTVNRLSGHLLWRF